MARLAALACIVRPCWKGRSKSLGQGVDNAVQFTALTRGGCPALRVLTG